MVTTSETNVLLKTNSTALQELAKSRSRIYGTLSVAYANPPDERLLELLRHWVISEGQSPKQVLPVILKRGLRKIGDWFKSHASQPSEISALGVEFTRLFRGVHRFHSPPPPYESVYVDGGLVYGASTSRASERYRRFQLKERNNEPPDHIALELDFMRFLCEKEAQAWQREQAVQDLLEEEGSFLKEHLARWVPALCENIRRFDATALYNGLADVTEGWIRCDRRIIKGLEADLPEQNTSNN